MSLFERLGTSASHRKQFFWLICIPIRIFIGLLFFFCVWRLKDWAAYTVGGIGIVAGINFFIQRIVDNKPNVWWFRIVHAVLYATAGAIAIALAPSDRESAAYTILGIFMGDVLFGVLSAAIQCPFSDSNNYSASLLEPPPGDTQYQLFGVNDTKHSVFTPW